MMGGDDNESEVHLNLVPLIDILCNILFFLLMSFASEELKYEGDIELPSADVSENAEPKVQIKVNATDLVVDDLKVADIQNGKVKGQIVDGVKIVPLYEQLNALRAQRIEDQGTSKKGDDIVYLFADKGTPFTLLSPIMKTAAMAGFPNFKFAVIKK